MVETDFRRARRPEQIEQRRRQILQAAALVLEEEGFNGVTLSGIARRVGLAKSNIYRYFEGREAILLELITGDWIEFAGAVEIDLLELSGSNDGDTAARVLASGFGRRPRFCELNSRLSEILERNLSEETKLKFKITADKLGRRVVDALHSAVPRMSVDGCIQAMRAVHAVAAGLWPMAEMSPKFARVLEGREMIGPESPFEDELELAVRALLFGLLVEAARRGGRAPRPRG